MIGLSQIHYNVLDNNTLSSLLSFLLPSLPLSSMHGASLLLLTSVERWYILVNWKWLGGFLPNVRTEHRIGGGGWKTGVGIRTDPRETRSKWFKSIVASQALNLPLCTVKFQSGLSHGGWEFHRFLRAKQNLHKRLVISLLIDTHMPSWCVWHRCGGWISSWFTDPFWSRERSGELCLCKQI